MAGSEESVMRKILLVCSFLFLVSVAAAQTTAVTATVTDSDGQTWNNGSWSLAFAPNPAQPTISLYNINGVPLSQSVLIQGGTMNGAGTLSFSSYQNGAITPTGSSWNLTVCPNATAKCMTYNFNTGLQASLNLSSVLSSLVTAPRFLAVAGTYGYNDSEASIQLVPGATYFNVTTACLRVWPGGAGPWGCSSTGAGIYVPIIGGTVTGALNISTMNTIVNAALQTGSDINAKINTAGTGCSWSCTVYVPAGTYNSVTTSTIIPLNSPGTFNLILDPAAIINYTGTGYSIDTVEVGGSPSASHLVIQGGIINGTSSGKGGVHLLPTNGISVHDMNIQGFSTSSGLGGAGIAIEGSILVNIYNNQLLGNYYGMHVWGTKCLTSTPFTCAYNQAGTTSSYTPNGLHAWGNIFGNSILRGAFLDSSLLGDSFQILNDTFIGNDFEATSGTGGIGLEIEGSVGTSVTSNYFEGSAAHDIILSHNAINVRVVGNWFTTSVTVPYNLELVNETGAFVEGNSSGGNTPAVCFLNTSVTGLTFYYSYQQGLYTSSNICLGGGATTPLGLEGFDNNGGFHFPGGLYNGVANIYLDSLPNRMAIEPFNGNGGEIVDNPVTQTLATWTNTGLFTFRTINSINGYQINSVAPTGHYPRGNGTNYVDSSIQAADLPIGTSPVKISNSLTPAAATASSCMEQTFTYTSLVTTQQVSVSPPSSLGVHLWIGWARVSATNTVAIAFCGDATAGTPPSGNYIVVAF